MKSNHPFLIAGAVTVVIEIVINTAPSDSSIPGYNLIREAAGASVFLSLFAAYNVYKLGEGIPAEASIAAALVFHAIGATSILPVWASMACFVAGFVFLLPWLLPQPHNGWEERVRQAAGQEERNRLARDLHDSVKQQIYAMQASVAAAQVRAGEGSETLTAALAKARAAARIATAEMEALLEHLRATPVNSSGLVSALRHQCDALRFRTNAAVELSIGKLPEDSEADAAAFTEAYRAGYDALESAASTAAAIRVHLDCDGRHLIVEVSGDGDTRRTAVPVRTRRSWPAWRRVAVVAGAVLCFAGFVQSGGVLLWIGLALGWAALAAGLIQDRKRTA